MSSELRELLFHIAPAADWAESADVYVPASFEREGFVHCSTRSQVVDVANALFRGRSDLVLLMVDPDRIDAPIRYENASGGSELFPHVYSGLPRASVISVEPLALGPNGSFQASSVDRCVSKHIEPEH